MKDGIIAHDLNRRIFYFNKRAEEITGYRRKMSSEKTVMRPLAALSAAAGVPSAAIVRSFSTPPSTPSISSPVKGNRAVWK
jgi:aspartyl/asparaginyl beta-hydroxylase (cupin superfamily)